MMSKIVGLSFLLVAGAFAASVPRAPRIDPDGSWRIVGGSAAAEGEFPYQVSLQQLGLHICGGSIVNETYVITAAHCVVGQLPILLRVLVGTNRLFGGNGTPYAVKKIFRHEDYDPNTITNDIAIIRVKKIELNEKVQIIKVESEEVGANVSVVLSGWGTKFNGGFTPNRLQHAVLKTLTVEDCRSRFDGEEVRETQICTFTKRGQGACHGDSGGPLVIEDKARRTLVGIVSWGLPCGVGYPDVYTRPKSFIPWLNDKCNNCLN